MFEFGESFFKEQILLGQEIKSPSQDQCLELWQNHKAGINFTERVQRKVYLLLTLALPAHLMP